MVIWGGSRRRGNNRVQQRGGERGQTPGSVHDLAISLSVFNCSALLCDGITARTLVAGHLEALPGVFVSQVEPGEVVPSTCDPPLSSYRGATRKHL